MSDYFGKPTGNLMWTGEGSRWRDERGEEVLPVTRTAYEALMATANNSEESLTDVSRRALRALGEAALVREQIREQRAEAVLRLSEVERERDQAVQRADRSDALLDLAKRDRFALLMWLRMNVGAYPHKVMIGREAYDLHEATRAWPERSYAVTGEADAEHDRFEPEVQP